MRSKLYFFKAMLWVAFGFLQLNATAQCSFEPTITGNVLMCPNEQITLSTQEYDSYQWERRFWVGIDPSSEWAPVAGATSQTLIIDQYEDSVFEFRVSCTLGGCTAYTPAVLADGYVYGLPYVSITFEPDTFQQIGDGEFNVCDGATVIFEEGFPGVYGIHKWFKCYPEDENDTTCLIPEFTGGTLTATSSGIYGFRACTNYCPNQCEWLSFDAWTQLNYGNFAFCTLGTNHPELTSENIRLYPNPTTQLIQFIATAAHLTGDFSIVDAKGAVVKQEKNFDTKNTINVGDLANGTYFLILTSKDSVLKSKFVKK